jgi:Zinc carboxypeptidase/FlgD Ig-like domain/Carboxypeptidase regulatory-like domain
MKRIIILIFLIFSLSSMFAWRDNEMEVRVFYQNDYELTQIQNLNPKGDIYPNGEALIYLIPSEFATLQTTGLRYQIEREDVKTFAENFWQSEDNTREAYHTYEEIVTLADSLVSAFPDICEKYLFGTSVQGRELGALKISDNVTLDENEAEVFFDGGIHGDEVGGPENIIRFAREICVNYGVDPNITNLIDNREIWLYYMVNPDGRVADERENANEVDCNRDSGYMWDAWGGSPGPFSQPESKALRDCHYNRQFVVHTTYHSGTEYISCPWSYRADQCSDFSHIIQLAGEYSTSSGYANMEYGQGCTGMYPINGSTKDTNYGMMGAISWSMEISYSKHPPAYEIMQYYDYNKPAMLSIIEHAGYGLEGVVTDANTGDPVTAAVFVDDYFPCYTDVDGGDYHKYVLPGTYDVKIVANGYETQTITGVTVTANSATATDFQLQPLDGQYVYKVSSSQIPNNNTADEGDTPGVIGAPDDRNYSIGKNGWIVIDMQNAIPDGAGNDFIVYEGDASPESYTAYAGDTLDGPWVSLGSGTGTTEFDLATGGVVEAQFIRIEDDGDGTATAADAGFDLDAIESIAEVAGVYIAFLGFELDEMVGNGNGYIDPNETIDMLISIRNNGSLPVNNVEGILSASSEYVTMNNDTVSFGTMAPGQEAFGIFTFTVGEEAPVGELITFELNVSANTGSYNTNFFLSCMVGVSIEDFESNSFNSFEWVSSGNAYWTTSTDAYEGNYCAISGNISDNESTSLFLEAEVIADGSISFYRKVSSEQGWDYYNFYIDNTQLGSWSGSSGWEEETYPVTTGNHTFKWEYTKDTNTSSGSDCGWVDYIVFPPIVNNAIQGYISGSVTLQGGSGDVEDVQISAGGNVTNPDASGYYTLSTFPGTYDVEATLVDYSIGLVEDVIVDVGATTSDIDFTLVGLDPPINLTAIVINYNEIELTWDAPNSAMDRTGRKSKDTNNDNSRDLIGYNVFLDSNYLGLTSELQFTILALNAGDYETYVTAVYDEGESGSSNPANVTITLPVPQDVTAQSQEPNVIISWSMPANRGLESFHIYRDTVLLADDVMASPYEDMDVPSGEYIYNVTAVYDDNWESEMSDDAIINHTYSNELLKPTFTELVGIYPNPFNPKTTVSFNLNQDADVAINVFNIKGQKVRTLVNEKMEAGYHQIDWQGNDDEGKPVSSGVYFVIVDANNEGLDFTSIKKVILLK